jgi:exonuclease SbcC
MIPLTGRVKNYKSYKEATIDLSNLETAVIVGPNCSGKSSVLSSFLHATHGKTPDIESKEVNEDELIKLGEQEMHNEWDVLHEGRLLRAVRKKSRGKGKHSTAALYEYDRAENKWNTLATGKNAAPTYEKIIGQTYESITTTSILLQTRGEQLLILPPGQRLSILLDHFGQTKYALYEKAARDKFKATAARRETLEEAVAVLLTEASSRADHEEALRNAEAGLAEVITALAKNKADLKQAYEKTAVLRNEILQHQQLSRRHDETLADMASLREKREGLLTFPELPEDIKTAVQSLYDQICIEGDHSTALAMKAEATARIAQIEGAATQSKPLKEKAESYEKSIGNLRARINDLNAIISRREEIEGASRKMAALDNKLAATRETKEALRKEIAELNRKLNELQELKTERATLQGQVQTAETERTEKLGAAKKDLRKAESDKEALKDATCHGIGKYAACPLIATAVSQRDAIPQLKAQIEELSKRPTYPQEERISSIDQSIAAYKPEAISLRIDDATRETEGLATEIQKKEQQRKSLETTSRLSESLASAQSDIATAEADIARYQSELDGIAQKLREASEQEAKLPALRNEEAALAAVVTRFARKTEADALAPQIDALQQTASSLSRQISDLPSKQRQLNNMDDDRARIERETTDMEGRHNDLLKATVNEKNALEKCRKAEADAEDKGKEISKLEYEEKIYSTLADAAKRIPYIMLDNLLPVIEDEANQVLSQISDTDMRMELSTRKMDSSSATIKDSLTIRVIDNAGERNVKLYSPGERTRLALALTLGIAETTAKRAGIKIETLIIDEPSYLDEKGFQQFGLCIKRLAQATKGRLKKILVITHSHVLREMFNQRVEVEKVGTDSTIEVIS